MLKNHPKGLMILFFTEMWERFGFYILMAVFVLYMDKQFGWPDDKKGDFYGAFLGAVYFFPLLGGYIGDRLLNRAATIKLGALFMLVGYLALSFSGLERLYLFYTGLGLVAFGTGIFKANISVIVGSLYRTRPELKDAGYNIFYMGINIGAALAPLAATIISIQFGSYNISFAAAAVGMLFSIAIFQSGSRFFASLQLPEQNSTVTNSAEKNKPRGQEYQRIITLVILFIIVIFFWIGFYQNGFALTLFAERSTVVLDYLRPETYQFFNPFFILVLTPPLLTFFHRLNLRNREPSTPLKIFFGMVIMGLSMFIMVLSSVFGGNEDMNIMSPMWLISTYLVVTLAEILISPMGLSFVSKVAPERFQGLMMGGWFGATAMGSYGSGLLGKYYSSFSHHEYFLILAGLLFLSAILVLLFLKKLKRFA